jgi:hypothetical protein
VAKFIIITNDGEIIRTINLPYEGILLDISDMPDAEFEELFPKIYEYKIEMEGKGQHKKDSRGLPKIVKKEN